MEPKQRLPMWLAVAITVVVAIPFGFWLKGGPLGFGLPLFVSFTVWAQYFVFGASPKGLLSIIPAYIGGGVGATLVQLFAVLLGKVFGSAHLVANGDLAVIVAYFIGFCGVILAMRLHPIFDSASLAYFQGISLTLGCIFTSSAPSWYGHTANAYLATIGGLLVSIIAMLLGCFLGWFNVTLTHGPVPETPPEDKAAKEAA